MFQWIDCLYFHRKEMKRSTRFYHDNEHECLRSTTSKDTENKEDVEQLEKQVHTYYGIFLGYTEMVCKLLVIDAAIF